MTRRKVMKAAVDLVTWLGKHPDATRLDCEAALAAAGHDTYFHHVVGYVRNVAGEEVLTTRYDREKRAHVYSLALTKDEGLQYVRDRRTKVRNESANLVGILDRLITKHGVDADLRLARAMLNSVVDLLDA